jgi:DNA-binding NarL/FixJ family response regulator
MKILLVDDHVIIREGLFSLLQGQPDIEVVGEAGSGKEAIQLALKLKPEVILMDFSLPDMDGPTATQAILEARPETKVIFLTIHETNDRLFAALRSGARGYLLKSTPISKMLAALRGLNNDEAALSRSMTTRVLEEFSRLGPSNEPDRSILHELTMREMDILRELALDTSNREIATRLQLSETTVKNHVHSVLRKLGLKNRQEAARFARHQGLVKYPVNY